MLARAVELEQRQAPRCPGLDPDQGVPGDALTDAALVYAKAPRQLGYREGRRQKGCVLGGSLDQRRPRAELGWGEILERYARVGQERGFVRGQIGPRVNERATGERPMTFSWGNHPHRRESELLTVLSPITM